MTYQTKYLKYKAKYLEKKKNILLGGAKSEVVFLLGGPGSGKGTVADKISRDFGYIQLTNSDVVKEERDNEDADPCLRKQIRESITNGTLISPEISIRLLRNKIIKLGLGKKILIDGFPRSVDRLQGWIDLNNDIADIKFILFLNCDPQTLYCRALQRGEQTGRFDDTKDTIRKRIDTYIEKTLPVLEFGKTVCKVINIDGNKSKSEVYEKVRQSFLSGGAKSEVVFLLGGPGSGKGTVADKISRDFGYIQLTNSDVVKEERDNEDADPCLRKQIRESITNGTLISPEISIRLLRNKIIKLGLGKKILIDGFPRSVDRLQGWIDLNNDIADIKFILFLNCDPQTLYCRALQRGEQTGRFDDTKDTIRKRIDTYIEKTLPVLEFGKTVCNVVNIDGNKSKSEVYEKVRQSFLSDAKSEVVFVVGGPGCGKGTISERISSEYGYLSITNSALLRDEMNNEAADPSLRQQIRNAISEGSILPTEILISILKKKLVELGPGKKIIIDGFPRNIEQLNIFLKECSDIINIKFILFLNCSPETMMKRAQLRGLLTRREDDTLDVIQNRISVYSTVTVHVMTEASRKGVPVVEIDSNKAVDEVYKEVKKHF